jgi:hypothetical protein
MASRSLFQLGSLEGRRMRRSDLANTAHGPVLRSEDPNPGSDEAAVRPSMARHPGRRTRPLRTALVAGVASSRLPAPSGAPVYDLVVRLRPESARIAVTGTITLPPAPGIGGPRDSHGEPLDQSEETSKRLRIVRQACSPCK